MSTLTILPRLKTGLVLLPMGPNTRLLLVLPASMPTTARKASKSHGLVWINKILEATTAPRYLWIEQHSTAVLAVGSISLQGVSEPTSDINAPAGRYRALLDMLVRSRDAERTMPTDLALPGITAIALSDATSLRVMKPLFGPLNVFVAKRSPDGTSLWSITEEFTPVMFLPVSIRGPTNASAPHSLLTSLRSALTISQRVKGWVDRVRLAAVRKFIDKTRSDLVERLRLLRAQLLEESFAGYVAADDVAGKLRRFHGNGVVADFGQVDGFWGPSRLAGGLHRSAGGPDRRMMAILAPYVAAKTFAAVFERRVSNVLVGSINTRHKPEGGDQPQSEMIGRWLATI